LGTLRRFFLKAAGHLQYTLAFPALWLIFEIRGR
jgi:hypothetical protein